jgi:hypothetical protein
MIMGCCAREHHIHANARDPAFHLRAVAAADQARCLLCRVAVKRWIGRSSADCSLRDLSLNCVTPCTQNTTAQHYGAALLCSQHTLSSNANDRGTSHKHQDRIQATPKTAAPLDFTSTSTPHSSHSPQRSTTKYRSTNFRALCDLYNIILTRYVSCT